jgi:hypothetical protein
MFGPVFILCLLVNSERYCTVGNTIVKILKAALGSFYLLSDSSYFIFNFQDFINFIGFF